MDINNVTLIGRLASDTEMAYTQSQKAICKFRIAVNRLEEGADYIPIIVWGKMAENCNRYLAKGSQVAIQGRIQTGSYTKRDGTRVYTTEVVANQVQFLSKGGEQSNKAGAPAQKAAPIQQLFDDDDLDSVFTPVDDGIPF